MTGTVYQIEQAMTADSTADIIAGLWMKWDSARDQWKKDKRELRKYIFATDTRMTSNAANSWKNSTTLPKLTQIRDNLHANYMSSIFPNDNWLRWEGYSAEAEVATKKTAITQYMANKCREDNFQTMVSQLIYDYIDYGNVFSETIFVKEFKVDPETGEEIPQYVGPRTTRIHPFDIVFNPLADNFEKSPKIVRKLKNFGELLKESEEQPDNEMLSNAMTKASELRKHAGNISQEDSDKYLDILLSTKYSLLTKSELIKF